MQPPMGEITTRQEFLEVASRRLARWLIMAAWCVSLPSQVGAQGMSCSTAQTILLKKSSARTELYGAMSRMVNCGDAAPGGIVKMLRQVTLRSTADTVARQGARALLDNRMMDSIRMLAVDVDQPTERRTFFLRLLTRYAAPNAGIDESQMNSDAPTVLTTVIHPGGVVGTSPMTADGKSRARATIQSMGSHDPDATLRKLAGLVHAELKYYVQ
jgi:hypothetical protein